MSTPPELRWQQRFASFQRALEALEAAADLAAKRPLSPLERSGLIKSFEFTYELAWNVLKDYLLFQGEPNVAGSRDAFREAFRRGLIHDGETWLAMITDRNRTAHLYDEATAEAIAQTIVTRYLPLFRTLAGDLATRIQAT
ncbi:nucleotidyltransferase substrate binding protein [Hydrogenophilus thiooxidans]|uniref:nucleotidyltransferase substrate binding protein n=1 Tax=Hydrogenophilus thiooxidans TaxID=2820326 RepID=UPI001C2140EC|nr:nucleotidyltransferase substrate binding protein [Hydrogenophilus thiooxidans]